MYMKILLLGSTGMLGQALYNEAINRGYSVVGAARSGGDRIIDISDGIRLKQLITQEKPNIIINTVAMMNYEYIEQHPGQAYLTNARPMSILVEASKEIRAYLIYISTDHFFCGDGLKKHDENYPVSLINEYARTKYLGECFTGLYEDSLIIRTNIVGFRGSQSNLTFVEWCIQMLQKKEPATLFDDYYTSSIDVNSFSEILLDLIEKHITGIINVASRDVFSKKEFIEKLAGKMSLDLSHTTTGSVKELKDMQRANSLGLDTGKAEKILGYKMPSLEEVIENLVIDYQKRMKTNGQ